jgi:hypothetical protein
MYMYMYIYIHVMYIMCNITCKLHYMYMYNIYRIITHICMYIYRLFRLVIGVSAGGLVTCDLCLE